MTDETKAYVLVIGNPIDGLEFVGPFASSENARVYASREDEYWIDELKDPYLGDVTTEQTLRPKTLRPGVDDHFGLCPHCVAAGDLADVFPYVNVRKSHYKLCEKHKVCWEVGSGLFSSWQEETEADWQRNREMLATLTMVKPAYLADADMVAF